MALGWTISLMYARNPGPRLHVLASVTQVKVANIATTYTWLIPS